MWLIVGLGNPGDEYEATRHNVGFMVVDALETIARTKLSFDQHFQAFCSKASIVSKNVAFIKPQTYMNRSGAAVQPTAAFYKIGPEQIIVIHDELDLPFGQLRIKKGGGAGGHNGLKDIIARLGDNFIRIRMGIGKPAIKGNEANFVLSRYRKEELPLLEEQIHTAIQAVEMILQQGVEKAQMVFNKQRPS